MIAKKKIQDMRQRGAMLLEAALAISVLLALVAYVAQTNGEEAEKQKRVMLASEHDVIITASRNFVQQSYHDIILDLFNAADSSGQGELVYSIDDIIAAGYLPSSYSGGILNAIYGKNYALLARAVNRDDGGEPQVTMTYSDMDPLGLGGVDNDLVDGDPGNGEMEIESILVSYGGSDIPRGAGGDIVGRLESAFGGFVTEANTAHGAYANFEMNISGFDSMAEYPGTGNFASVVSLSSYGVLGSDGGMAQVVDPFRRCDGVNIASDEYSECINSNEVYTDLIMRPFDSDNDGTIDVLPALRNVTMLDCSDTSNTGTISEFTIDCATTRMTGDFVSLGDNAEIGNMKIEADGIDFAGQDVLTRQNINGSDENILNGDRLTMASVNGGQDMSEAVTNTSVVAARSTIEKPTCPATTIDGVTPMEPRVYLSPAAYSDPRGRPVVGVRAFAEDLGTEWRARLLIFVSQDFCSNDTSNPIPTTFSNYFSNGAPNRPNCSTFNPNGSVNTFRGDGQADVYELMPTAGGQDFGAVIASTRCY
ncbi:hypothetical protein KUV57_13150 [Epibacterium sp. DP7N7-1]|nr:hypothetical protein [Epibacterium sp. DP7N7-1]